MWAWIIGAAVVIIIILGLWWLNMGGSTHAGEAGYNATSTDALVSNNAPTTPAVSAQARTGSVVSVLSGIPDASKFAAQLGSTGVASSLTGKGPYTLFVPINEAYAHVAPGVLSGLSAAQLKRLIQYHIVSGKAIDVNIQQAGTVQALSTDTLNFSVRPGDKSARINSSVALQSFKAQNGVVYLIDQVLIPPTAAAH